MPWIALLGPVQDTVISTENPATARSEIMSEESRGNPSRGPAEIENPNENDDNEELQSDQLQDVPDWLQVAIVPDELLCCRLVWYMGENKCANGLSQSANQTCIELSVARAVTWQETGDS